MSEQPGAEGHRGRLLTRLLFSFLPVLVTAGLLAGVLVLFGLEPFWKLIGLMAAIFVALGKFAVFWGISADDPMRPYYVATLIVYMDTCVAFLVAFNLDWLYKIRGIGPRLERVQDASGDILEVNPWMRKATFLGVMLFVAFPLTGTGAIGGTLLGRIMGLPRRRIMLGILIGACLGAFGLATGAYLIGDNLEALLKSWYVTLPMTLLVVGLFAWLNYRIQQKVKVARVQRETARVERSE